MKTSRQTALLPVVLLALLPVGGTLAMARVSWNTSVRSPESISGSFIAFNSAAGGVSCYIPGATDTFCFKAESFTDDWTYAEDQFLLFPGDWQVHNAYDAGPTTCDNGGSFNTFGWAYHSGVFEVRIDQDRQHVSPADHCLTNVCVVASAGSNTGVALVSWYWDSDNYGELPNHPCSNDGYTPDGLPYECDQMIYPPASIPPCQTVYLPLVWARNP